MNPIISSFLQVLTASKDTIHARPHAEAMQIDEASSPSTIVGSVPDTLEASDKGLDESEIVVEIAPAGNEEIEEEVPWWIENWPALKRTRMNDGS